MSGETFVDLTYRGLELGRRHKLCEVGPTTAYLEFPTPMPVGSRLELLADGGVQVAVEVVRVHEQVAGAERSPGMRVKAPALDERAASWWKSLVSVADPAPPTIVVAAPSVAPAPSAAPDDDVDTTVIEAERPVEAADVGEGGRITEVTPVVGEAGARAPAGGGSRTEVMSAVDIDAIVATAGEDSEPSADRVIDPGSNGRKKRGGRKRAPKK